MLMHIGRLGFIYACPSSLGSCLALLVGTWQGPGMEDLPNNGGMQKWKGQRREATK